MNAAGSFIWNDTPTQFSLSGVRLDELFSGRESSFSASATWPAGNLAAEGSGSFADGLSLRGQGSLQSRSLRETLTWAGTDIALSPFLDSLAIDGTFESSGRTLLLPSMRMRLGDNSLEGAGSISFAESRPALQATLAAESLNLAPALATLIRVFGPDESLNASGWSRQSLALRPFTGGDLDLRLSAGTARLGPLVMEDLASSLLVREGSVEGSLARAVVRGGIVKGRFGLTTSAADRGETELRAQGAFDRLDLGALLVDFGQEGWLLGNAQGQFTLEGSGRTAASLIDHLNGRSSLAMENGTLAGLDLADVVHRNGVAADGALARRNARTPFDRAGNLPALRRWRRRHCRWHFEDIVAHRLVTGNLVSTGADPRCTGGTVAAKPSRSRPAADVAAEPLFEPASGHPLGHRRPMGRGRCSHHPARGWFRPRLPRRVDPESR